MQTEDYTGANRTAWNKGAAIHAHSQMDKLLHAFGQPGHSCLDEVVTDLLLNLGLSGKAVAQLCCNNGRELLSIRNLGAGDCVGFDISDEFIAQARQLAAAGNIPCDFVRSDVYAIPASYDRRFDLVFISVGALGWLPDLQEFFGVVDRLLRPGGALLIYEMHPILDMFEEEDRTDPPLLRHSYFRTEPYIDLDGLDYYTGTTYDSSPSYWFHHSFADVLQAILDRGLILRHIREYGHDISAVFAHFADMAVKPPLCYTLLAVKPEAPTM